jgi:hypothetical protein
VLFFYDAILAEDPQADSMQQFPHAKGAASEAMLLLVYQHYSHQDSGVMCFEQLIEFIDDSGVLQTHAPHDDNDEPLEEWKSALDPVSLLCSLPRPRPWPSVESSIDEGRDALALGFGQFYSLLLRIAAIVYPVLYADDATVAFNKLLLEMILPLYAWCKGGGCKRGAGDALVVEERVLLVMLTYAPNLWKVFLTYAQDAVGKVRLRAAGSERASEGHERG